jgi:hypothetical protein
VTCARTTAGLARSLRRPPRALTPILKLTLTPIRKLTLTPIRKLTLTPIRKLTLTPNLTPILRPAYRPLGRLAANWRPRGVRVGRRLGSGTGGRRARGAESW